MNRRNFLKTASVATVFAAAPIKVISSDAPNKEPVSKPLYAVQQGMIRAMKAYDVRRDQYIYRYDISDGKNQYGVSTRGDAMHKEAIDFLIKDAGKEIDFNNLVRLPLPPANPEMEFKYI
jgi:hypothetical protein